MRIESVEVKNYKSLYQFGPVRFGPGFNVIVGANNTGKSSLLKVLSLNFEDKPHVSRRTKPHPDAQTEPQSSITLHIHLDVGEIYDVLIDSTNAFSVPATTAAYDDAEVQRDFQVFSQAGTFVATWARSGSIVGDCYLQALGKAPDTGRVINFVCDRQTRTIQHSGGTAGGSTYAGHLASAVARRIFMFNAERLYLSSWRFGRATQLVSNASNLPEVLNTLQGNPIRFARLNNYIREIFPDVGRITTVPGPVNDQVQILVWPSEEAGSERSDLAFPLDESGTGIGQVLAILYVVLTADRPQVIIIDEPQSFLHPGAVRKLIEILRQHGQHQFIVTTHSADVISAAEPTTVTLLRKEGSEMVAESIDVAQARELEMVLASVGARLSDVFGADNILWVEGATEEQCYPVIVRRVLKRSMLGTRIIGVLHTGDFDSGDPTRTIEIYRRLSHGSSLLPPAVGFIFDREGRSADERAGIQRRMKSIGGKVEFTHRRMYENYLLQPAALAAVMNSLDGFCDTPISEQEVAAWLERARTYPSYVPYDISSDQLEGAGWLDHVDGAALLADLFSQLSEQRYTYDKKLYGLALTEWLADNAPECLKDIADLIDSMLSGS